MKKNFPSHIAILAGSIINDNGVWRAPTYTEGEEKDSTGDYLRTIAGAYIANEQSYITLITSGGYGYYSPLGAPPLSDMLAHELVKQGVPSERIIKESASRSTYGQLLELQKLMHKHSWTQIGILSNTWHLPRIKAMLTKAPRLEYLRTRYIVLIPAEETVLAYHPETWKDVISQAMQSDGMKKRLTLEQKGIDQINAGTYTFTV